MFDGLRAERQSARLSKKDDSLTWSGTWCFIALPIWQQGASKGLKWLSVNFVWFFCSLSMSGL